jgi:hypothetical protein
MTQICPTLERYGHRCENVTTLIRTLKPLQNRMARRRIIAIRRVERAYTITFVSETYSTSTPNANNASIVPCVELCISYTTGRIFLIPSPMLRPSLASSFHILIDLLLCFQHHPDHQISLYPISPLSRNSPSPWPL